MRLFHRFFCSVPGAVEIYRGGDRLRFYRFLGLFCLGHTLTWTGLTYYRGWYNLTERENVQLRFDGITTSVRKLFGFPTEAPKDDSLGDEAVSNSKTFPEGINESSFLATQLRKLRAFSEETRKYDEILFPVFTSLLGELL